ncbi:ImmA/IrrE family metallo-endopeptidase [Ahniella affigens]|nr:ImmA/IrrE family metallo-endopeptidase [Ahniella affigens]
MLAPGQKFNHHLLVIARESRGYTQADLSTLSSIAQGTVSKYETGAADPPEGFVEEIAKVLDYPTGFFYEPGRPYGFPPFHYRRRKKLSMKVLGRIVAQMNIRRMHIQKMCVSFDIRSVASGRIPEIDPHEYVRGVKGPPSVEDIARNLRELWMLPRGPIPNMVDLLESSGGIVIHCDFGSDLIDAMSQRIDGMPILFFVNTNAPADRVRHTLAHELGHMVLHTTTLHDDDVMEDEADAFAGALLLPREEFKAQLRRFDLRQLANMKQFWKVSMASMAVRASRLNLITPYQSKTFWMEMGKLGYRMREPHEPSPEHGSLLRRMVKYHTDKLGYSTDDMCKLLNLNKKDYVLMYGDAVVGSQKQGPRLQLVK